ncbi:hypothetical protein BDZ94DRAFT_1261732 [Collybia nuda]|uniref:Uncharacterized protein n=1 Tax=Collybia nuda TaxID=64659 RepID=A0A9P6CHD8_9AGAR|nr:hypothetical protein BDZ94DRAFT_1261732 [Collybia nuda]
MKTGANATRQFGSILPIKGCHFRQSQKILNLRPLPPPELSRNCISNRKSAHIDSKPLKYGDSMVYSVPGVEETVMMRSGPGS